MDEEKKLKKQEPKSHEESEESKVEDKVPADTLELEADQDQTENQTSEVDKETPGVNEKEEDLQENPLYERNLGYVNKPELGMKKWLIWVVILAALIGAGYFAYASLFRGASAPKEESRETVTQTPTPSPTPASLVRSQWSLEVLNGSGVTGAAKKLADQLTDLGYVVLKVGNADRETYEQTQILIREDLESKVDALVVDLKDTILIASYGGILTDSSSTASARIIIGK